MKITVSMARASAGIVLAATLALAPTSASGAGIPIVGNMMPVPALPLEEQPTWIAILYTGERYGALEPRVTVRQELPVARSVQVQPIRLQPGLIDVTLPPLAAGRYVARYYDQSAEPDDNDTPTLEVRFHVSRRGPVEMIEYYSAALDHYFYTGDETEIRIVDSGGAGPWARTGQSFRAVRPDEIPSFGRPVCRYYGPTMHSHFYSASPGDCMGTPFGADPWVVESPYSPAKWPSLWVLESDAVFGVITNNYPYTCEESMQRLYRVYNNRDDVNYRYTTSEAIRDQMLARGWLLQAIHYDGPYETPYSLCVVK